MEVSVPGSILNVNTVEAFKEVDKKRLIEQVGSLVRDAIESGEYLTDPSILQRFVLLTFADLKGLVCKHYENKYISSKCTPFKCFLYIFRF